MRKDNGGPAFPTDMALQAQGVTVRDYFAAKAVTGLIAGAMADGSTFEGAETARAMARAAGMIADAMLRERIECQS